MYTYKHLYTGSVTLIRNFGSRNRNEPSKSGPLRGQRSIMNCRSTYYYDGIRLKRKCRLFYRRRSVNSPRSDRTNRVYYERTPEFERNAGTFFILAYCRLL